MVCPGAAFHWARTAALTPRPIPREKRGTGQDKQDISKREESNSMATTFIDKARITVKAGNGGKLFGAVTNKEISEGLKAQYGIDIPKQKLVLDEPIKAFGSYQVKAKLGFEVNGTVYVSVYEEK